MILLIAVTAASFANTNWLESALIKLSKFESDNSFVKSAGSFFLTSPLSQHQSSFLIIRSNSFNLLHHFIHFSKDVIHNINFVLFILTFICILIFNFCSGFFFLFIRCNFIFNFYRRMDCLFAIEYILTSNCSGFTLFISAKTALLLIQRKKSNLVFRML